MQTRRRPSPRPRPPGRAGRAGRAWHVLVAAAAVQLVGAWGSLALLPSDASLGDAVARLAPAFLAALVTALLAVHLKRMMQATDRRTADVRRSHDALQRELRRRATHDPLTGLANRALLVQRLDRARGSALLLLDLDDFKDVNDVLGHLAGDRLLAEVARRLRAALPDAELLARVGGDEFAALWRDGATPASEVAERVLARLRSPYRLGGRTVDLTATGGLVLLRDGRAAADALRDADLARYAAKEAGKNRLARFDPSLRVARDRHTELLDGLRRALAHDEFTLHYQPVVRLADGRVTAVEALLRWTPPGRSPVPPASFVPLAEASGMIVPIGWWVLRRACAEARRWHDEHGVRVTVNVSGHQLREPDFVQTVLAVLAEERLPTTALVLELTETTLVANVELAERLDRLRSHGVRVAIDDFGTGYSSLSYLVRLPVDILKIDRVFTGPPGQPAEHHRAFTKAILDLAASLRLDTVAEGVETAEQARTLRALDCPYAQGYHFARPVPGDRITALLGVAEASMCR